jgi:adenylosuccinate synthase
MGFVSNTVVVGLQWGDEAKGKIVDLLCDQHDVVVRYQGGANAGHTVVIDGTTYKLSLIPTGILRKGVECVIGNGVVVHPPSLLQEIERLRGQGVSFEGRLHISDRAHLVMPWHIAEERLTEESSSDVEHLGTTRRGIGPCYRDKYGRVHGLRVGDLEDAHEFRAQLKRAVAYKNRLLGATLTDFEPLDGDRIADEYLEHGRGMSGFFRDTTSWLHEAMARGKRLLFEGAQGSLLDIDHGTYPYVTSSNSSAAGVTPGSGVPARAIERWLGVIKAYTTRVGGGPFPTELTDETGERIRRVGREYGTVTGRPRRCGWFDAVAVRHSARVCGATEISLMLLDVLSGIEELKVAVAYENGSGERIDVFPSRTAKLADCRPIYETLRGWGEDLSQVRSWHDLPTTAREYVLFLSRQVGVPVTIVSVGPDRQATLRAMV